MPNLLGFHVHRIVMPIGRRQRCPECGMSRRYVIGEKPGRWERDGEYGIRFRRVRALWLKMKEER